MENKEVNEIKSNEYILEGVKEFCKTNKLELIRYEVLGDKHEPCEWSITLIKKLNY